MEKIKKSEFLRLEDKEKIRILFLILEKQIEILED